MMPTKHSSFRSNARRRVLLLGLPLLLVAIAACSRGQVPFLTQGHDPAYVWPPPPEPPRLGFVLAASDHRALFREAGGLAALGRWLAGPTDSAMVRPFALALHPAGGLLVADPGRQRVHFYDWARRRYLALEGAPAAPLSSPVGVAALPDGRILVSDSRLERVLAFDADGKPLGDFCPPGTLARPAGLAVAAGAVFIADVLHHRIAVFDLQGRPLRQFGRRGDAPGEFNYPTHLAAAPDGRLLVADSMNFRLQLLSPEGAPLAEAGGLGSAPGRFANPKGVALDRHGRIYAIEGLHDVLQIFDDQGRLLLNVGAPGQGPGEFWLPAGLCLDAATGRLYVADSYNGRVQIFQLLPEVAP